MEHDDTLSPAAIGQSDVLKLVAESAEREGWILLGAIVREPEVGTVQNGTCFVDKQSGVWDQNKRFAALNWANHPGVGGDPIEFFRGRYDLTREQAARHCFEKANHSAFA